MHTGGPKEEPGWGDCLRIKFSGQQTTESSGKREKIRDNNNDRRKSLRDE